MLYHIKWRLNEQTAKHHCYVMDKTVSPYASEQEVLIKDGLHFKVESVEDTIINGKKVVKIVMKNEDLNIFGACFGQ